MDYKDNRYTILIDDEDYDKIKDLNINIRTNNNYKKRVMTGTGLSLHRYIVNSTSNQICIHKNNNPFDFRKENLFITTRKELKDLIRNGEIQQRFDELNRIYYVF